MGGERIEQTEGRRSAQRVTEGETALSEANAGREDLVRQERRQSEDVRSGRRRSGVSEEFPAPEIVGAPEFRGRPSVRGTESGTADRADMTFAAHVDRFGHEVIDQRDGDDYRGHPINRDVSPGKHVVQSGETLESVARSHLGAGAGETEVRQHAEEIAHVNRLDAHGNLAPGSRLLLPGHTADGGFVTMEPGGDNRTVWADGTERVEGHGSGYVRRPDGTEHHWGPNAGDNYDVSNTNDGGIRVQHTDGSARVQYANGSYRVENADRTGYSHNVTSDGFTEHHWGPRSEDNYELTRTAEGRYSVSERGEPARDVTGAADERAENARIRDLAENRITNPQERERFLHDMETFERRARDQHLRPHEVAETYSQISRLMEAEGNQPFSPEQRLRLAEQVMHQAAEPTSINQGGHPTCNVATIESRTYTRSPSDAARLVADVATTGEFRGADGTVVRPDTTSLSPDNDALRSHASQVFQVTAVNLHWARVREQTHGTVDYDYRQVAPNYASSPPDVGDRLVNRATGAEVIGINGQPVRAPGITPDAMHSIGEQITGQQEQPYIIGRADYLGTAVPDTLHPASEQELRDDLARLRREGRLPAVVEVDANNEPFWTDSGAGAAGGSGTAHVVTITDYDPSTGTVAMDNQWGDTNDRLTGSRRMSVHDLYQAMGPGPPHPRQKTV